MPRLPVAEASNAAFSPSYIPIAVFVGGTSGVGRAMAEALARQTNGRAHIILIGQNAAVAEEILAGFTKPTDTDGWAHEFISCDATSMASVRAVSAGLRARLARLNFLVMTVGGPGANSITACGETPEGLDNHLAVRYFARYLYTKELLPLLVRAQYQGQHAHVMSVCGAGYGWAIPADDLGLDEARRRTIKILQGSMLSFAAMKAIIRSVAYNDGLVAYFAAQHPNIAFTHISPGNVLTPGGSYVYLGWLLTPLALLANTIRRRLSVTQDECAQYMFYALLDGERGLFIRDNYGDIISSHVFSPDHTPDSTGNSPKASKSVRESGLFSFACPDASYFFPPNAILLLTASISSSTFLDMEMIGNLSHLIETRQGVLNGVPMKGYGGSDATVEGLIAYTERVLAKI